MCHCAAQVQQHSTAGHDQHSNDVLCLLDMAVPDECKSHMCVVATTRMVLSSCCSTSVHTTLLLDKCAYHLVNKYMMSCCGHSTDPWLQHGSQTAQPCMVSALSNRLNEGVMLVANIKPSAQSTIGHITQDVAPSRTATPCGAAASRASITPCDCCRQCCFHLLCALCAIGLGRRCWTCGVHSVAAWLVRTLPCSSPAGATWQGQCSFKSVPDPTAAVTGIAFTR
jgi:hypothetical protein